MSLKIYSADNLPKTEWSQLTGNCVYVSPAFAAVWRTMGGREIFAVDETDGALKAGMAGIIFGGRMLPRLQSMPDGLPGGVYCTPEYGPDEKKTFMKSIMSWMRSERIIRADINNPPDAPEIKSFKHQQAATHIINIEGGSYSPPRKEVRKHIRAAKRREAWVTTMNDEKYLARFYDLVVATEQRHDQKPRYTHDFFAELLKVSLNDDRIKWFVALVDEKIIGYRICFIDRTELMTWQYYSDKRFTRLKPGYLLLDHIINYAIERNLKTINMGCSPPDADSLVDYKERWGGQKESFSYYTYFSLAGKILYWWRSR